MEHNDQEFLVQKIRTQYTEKTHTQLDTLRELDKKVKRPANIIACVLGSIGAIVMGCGMSLVTTDIGTALGLVWNSYDLSMAVGITTGIAGLCLLALAYPLYGWILHRERQRIAPEILRLADELSK